MPPALWWPGPVQERELPPVQAREPALVPEWLLAQVRVQELAPVLAPVQRRVSALVSPPLLAPVWLLVSM